MRWSQASGCGYRESITPWGAISWTRWIEIFNSSAGVVFCTALICTGGRSLVPLVIDEHNTTDLCFLMWIYDTALPVGGFLISVRYLIE
jgi:TRAP-type C4-dicarboxylate transport system permease small subunit